MITLVPAYGRDYNKKSDARKDFERNKDFRVKDISSKFDGRVVNLADLRQHSDHNNVKIRFDNERRNAIINLDHFEQQI